MRSSFVSPLLIVLLGLAACSNSGGWGGGNKDSSSNAGDAGKGASAPAAGSSADGQTSNRLGGSPVAGICFLSRQAVFANAKAGKAANDRLQQLAQDAQHDLDNERAPLDAAIKQLRSDAPHLSAADRQSREQKLAQQMRKFQLDSEQRRRELGATRMKATQQLAEAAQPLIDQAYKAHDCGLLLDRNVVLGGNTTHDLTADVVRTLDEKTPSISFELVRLPAPSASASGTP